MNPANNIGEALFDLHLCVRKGTCKNCGEEFAMPRKRQFCSPKCSRAFHSRKHEERLHARCQFTQHFDLPSPKLCQKDAEAVELYTEKKRGIKSIAWWQGRSSAVVRRGLIRAGVYRPDPKHNGTAKAGTGPYSKILQRQRIQEREKTWRHKMAVCLWHLRRGTPVEAMCQSNNWNAASVWNHLGKNKTYQKWKKSHPSKMESVQDYRNSQTYCWRSKKYSIERTFRDAIKSILKGSPFTWSPEKKLTHSRSRADFEMNGSIYLECKISTKSVSFFRAMGQAIHYKLRERKQVWIVLPDDVSVRKDQLETLEELGIQVLNESALRSKLSGQEVFGSISTKTTVARGFCKCCAKSDVTISRNPSGDLRSFCVNCEDEIKQRVFDSRQDRWIKAKQAPHAVRV
jgi:hypothetical protein